MWVTESIAHLETELEPVMSFSGVVCKCASDFIVHCCSL